MMGYKIEEAREEITTLKAQLTASKKECERLKEALEVIAGRTPTVED